ncbi:hypothetical protein Ciccas_001374 [Cichlidogyrus casuarinus]|uniref:Uncharacterized protein n=1 Tax=Cichlidogyrus casuarinus TaxID=1844966 RepID=A0ABD2QMI6_9PLAT
MVADMFSFKYAKRLWPRDFIQEVVAVLNNEFLLAPRLKDNQRYLENIKCNYYYSWTPFLSKGSESENSPKTDEVPQLMERRSDRVLVSAEDAEDVIMKAHISFNHVQTPLLHHNLCKNYANITQRMIAQAVERNCEACLRIWESKKK